LTDQLSLARLLRSQPAGFYTLCKSPFPIGKNLLLYGSNCHFIGQSSKISLKMADPGQFLLKFTGWYF
jgi:hypothetical protein